jgi:Family of unknown function (DUF5995)
MSTQPAQLPTTIDAVIDRMEQIDAELDPRDGVACFNHVYLTVTRLIRDNVRAGTFQDNAFLERMDVIFADMYLAAVAAAESGEPVNTAWAPLFAARDNRVVWPIQFALAGMNAHINHDLPDAVVKTCVERGTTPDTPPVHADYLKVNDLLASVEAQIRAEFETQIVHVATQPAETLKHIVGSFSITAARDAAWLTAQGLWRERSLPFVYDQHLENVARLVATASRALLVPVIPPPPA